MLVDSADHCWYLSVIFVESTIQDNHRRNITTFQLLKELSDKLLVLLDQAFLSFFGNRRDWNNLFYY